MLLSIVITLWGVNVIMIKYLTMYFPPLALAPIRLTLAVGLLFPLVMWKHGYHRLSREAWLMVAGAAAFSVFLHHLTLTVGLAKTSGTHGSLILGLSPLFVALLASRLMLKSESSPFVMEMPLYHAPNWRGILVVTWHQVISFVKRAGTVILQVSVVVWVLSAFPGKTRSVNVKTRPPEKTSIFSQGSTLTYGREGTSPVASSGS
jgi:hypothetical protein